VPLPREKGKATVEDLLGCKKPTMLSGERFPFPPERTRPSKQASKQASSHRGARSGEGAFSARSHPPKRGGKEIFILFTSAVTRRRRDWKPFPSTLISPFYSFSLASSRGWASRSFPRSIDRAPAKRSTTHTARRAGPWPRPDGPRRYWPCRCRRRWIPAPRASTSAGWKGPILLATTATTERRASNVFNMRFMTFEAASHMFPTLPSEV